MSQENNTKFVAMMNHDQPIAEGQIVSRSRLTIRTIAGGILGAIWGITLRGWMVILALNFGERPQFTWLGTIGGIIIPATSLGAFLGWVKIAGIKHWGIIISPFLLVLGPAIFTKDFFSILINTGMGGGSIGVALIGMFGAYAFSGIGASWKRWISGMLAGLFSFTASIGLFLMTQKKPGLPDSGKIFGMILFLLLMGLLVVGVSAPFRHSSKSSGLK